MLDVSKIEYACTSECQSVEHGNRITVALKMTAITEDKLAAFIVKTCRNFINVQDSQGRTVLHTAAIMGHYALMKWLLNQKDIKINRRDKQFSSTPLHYAVYYGNLHCAVLLMRYGASTDIMNFEYILPLQTFGYYHTIPLYNEMYAWGINTNHNLALTNDDSTEKCPHSMHGYFRRPHNMGYLEMKKIAIGTYHTLFMSSKGELFSVGHGKGGRLGHGDEHSLSVPAKVKLCSCSSQIIDVSVSKYHSLIATKTKVMACGLNIHHALGVPDVQQLLNFTMVIDVSNNSDFNGRPTIIKGVVACDYYSIAYSADGHIYMWGTNFGQMPEKEKNEIVQKPYLVNRRISNTSDMDILLLSASNRSFAVLNQRGDIYLYSNYQTKKIIMKYVNWRNPGWLLCNDEGVDSSSQLIQLLVVEENNILIWSSYTELFFRCSLTPFELCTAGIERILWNGNKLYIVFKGFLYIGTYNKMELKRRYKTKPKNTCSEIDGIPSTSSDSWQYIKNKLPVAVIFWKSINIDLEFIPYFNRITDIYSDSDLRSFIVTQDCPQTDYANKLYKRPQNFYKLLYRDITEFSAKELELLRNADTYVDSEQNANLYDCLFHVDGVLYPAHKMVIIDRAPGICSLIKASEYRVSLDHIPELNGKLFQLFLKQIYLNVKPTRKEILTALDYSVYALTIYSYIESLLEIDSDTTEFTNLSRFDYEDHVELSDVSIKCKDGPTLHVHKCILLAHSEYFTAILRNHLVEQTINIETIPYNYMLLMMKWLYCMGNNYDIKHYYTIYRFCTNHLQLDINLYEMIIYCDQLLLFDLCWILQTILIKQINIKNCLEYLQFAAVYNCEYLKDYCYNYIALNFDRIMFKVDVNEWNDIEELDLCGIREKYLMQHFSRRQRMLSEKHSLSLDYAEILEFVKDFKVDVFMRTKAPNEEGKAEKVCQKTVASSVPAKQESSVRKFEKEAILAMKRNISNENDHINGDQKNSDISDFIEKYQIDCSNDELLEEEGDWRKVGKKRIKRRVDDGEQQQENASSLPSSPRTRDKFIEFLKLSYDIYDDMVQEERARMYAYSIRHIFPSLTKTSPVKRPENPWRQFQSSNGIPLNRERRNIAHNPNSFANVIRNQGTSYVPEISPPEIGDKPIKSKRSPKQGGGNVVPQCHSMPASKPLHLIQMEEKAIDDLKELYNAKDAIDEVITVMRLCDMNSTSKRNSVIP